MLGEHQQRANSNTVNKEAVFSFFGVIRRSRANVQGKSGRGRLSPLPWALRSPACLVENTSKNRVR